MLVGLGAHSPALLPFRKSRATCMPSATGSRHAADDLHDRRNQEAGRDHRDTLTVTRDGQPAQKLDIEGVAVDGKGGLLAGVGRQ